MRGILSNPALCKSRLNQRDQILPAVFAPSATVSAAVAAITTAAATAPAVAAATAARTFFAWARFVDGQRATVEALAVEGLNRSVSAFFVFHGDKRETARAAAEFVHDHIDFDNVAVRGEHILKLIFSSVEGKISNKQFRAHDDFTFLIFD
jgi:hypothetical protein